MGCWYWEWEEEGDGWDAGHQGAWSVRPPRICMLKKPQTDNLDSGCLLRNCPNTPNPFVTRATNMLNGENIPSDAPFGVGVEEQENPHLPHMARGPLSAGHFRLCIQQVLSLWISGSVGWGGEV